MTDSNTGSGGTDQGGPDYGDAGFEAAAFGRTLRLQRLAPTGTDPAADPGAGLSHAARIARLAIPLDATLPGTPPTGARTTGTTSAAALPGSGSPGGSAAADALSNSVPPDAALPPGPAQPAASSTGHRAHRVAPSPAAIFGRPPEPPIDLTGRADDIAHLTDRVHHHSGLGPALLAVTGPEGTGRTSLALAVAHRLTADRPGGILHARLCTARGVQADPADIIARFLGMLGAPPDQIPITVDEGVAHLRRLLLRRPAVLVLDDADDPALLDPLIPHAPGSVVILTAHHPQPRVHAEVRTGPLTREDAHEFLSRLIGATRATCDPHGVDTLIAVCGGQPMALRLAGALLQSRPRWTVTDLLDRMAAAPTLAAKLQEGEPGVRAAFACTYAELSRPAARLLRHLALVPTDECTPELAAALTGSRLAETIPACDELRQAAIIEPGRHLGRFHLHPLLRHYAGILLLGAERLPEQQEARRRLITWYLDAACAATTAHRGRELPNQGRALRPFDDADAARAWAAEEGPALLDAARLAAAYGLDATATRLAVSAAGLLEPALPQTARLLYETAVRAAARAEDPTAEATAWLRLGRLLRRTGHPDQAGRALHTALRLGRDHGADRIVGAACAALAATYADDGQLDDALRWYQQSLEIREATGDAPGVRAALWARLGRLHADAERPDAATTAYENALALYEECGDEEGRARLLLALAAVAAAAGRHEQAMRSSRSAVAAFHALGDAFLHACALMQLAELLAAVPDPIASGVCRREALGLAAALPPDQALAVERLAHRTAGGLPGLRAGTGD